MKKIYSAILFLCFIVFLSAGCSQLQFWGPTHGSVQIKAFIDGSDTIKIRSNELWYEHHKYDLPGKWQGRFDEPTFVNETEWKPEWNGLMSNRFQELCPPLPKKAMDEITLTKLQGRGEVNITAKPTKENDYTLSIYIDDNRYDGAEWYEIKVEW